jgi:hypothetical protein
VDSKPRAFARLWAIVRPAAAKPDHKSVEAGLVPQRGARTTHMRAAGAITSPKQVRRLLAKDGASGLRSCWRKRLGPFPFRLNRNGSSSLCLDAFSWREPGFHPAIWDGFS